MLRVIEREAFLEKRCILILGGARSGKSRFAQKLAAELGKRVLYVATGEAHDEEMRQRIDEHRRNRPPNWRTLEVPVNVGRRILEEIGNAQVVVLECLTLLVSNVIGESTAESDPEAVDVPLLEERLDLELRELMGAVNTARAYSIVVSNEVGLGLVPANRLGRLYRDLLGKANQAFAERADEVYLMVAGLPLQLKP
ncbi:MAG: bifunctional adenosylcobinamide kinase/adenosylcobinamide-phosphate guanylyltransferase [Anaerolineae bacterium]|nr:bifunctional adenosylcobinamide kinase/adenosylcobinamide-phosphate guanylyltransferase [Anaerolineae bacterium]